MFSNHQITNKLEEHEQQTLKLQADQNQSLILSSAIVELWLSQKPHHSSWSKLACGILCLVEKKYPKSDFFQLLDLKANILWEQEIYHPFTYKAITKNFHYFPAQEQNVGFNFAFTAEAETIERFVGKYTGKQQRESKSDQSIAFNLNESSYLPKKLENPQLDNEKFDKKLSDTKRVPKQKDNRFNTIFNSQKEKARRFFSFRRAQPEKSDRPKLEISSPNDFRVVQRVEITGDSIKINAKDEQTKHKINEILSKLNVKSNRRTQQFVGDFLKKIQTDSEFEEKIVESEEEQKLEAKCNFQAPIVTKRASIKSLSIKPLVVEQNQSVEVTNRIDEQVEQAGKNCRYTQPNMLDVLKTELEKRAQYFNQSDTDPCSSDDESDSEWN